MPYYNLISLKVVKSIFIAGCVTIYDTVICGTLKLLYLYSGMILFLA